MGRELRKEYKEKFLKEGRKLYVEYSNFGSRWSRIYGDWTWKEPLEKPILWGTRVSLEILPSIKEKEFAGLSEAIEASAHYIDFSGDELRFCNMKHRWLSYNDNKTVLENYFDEHKYYIKGRLKLAEITDKKFEKLSEDAKAWFKGSVRERVIWGGHVVKETIYTPHIPRTFVREVQIPLYITTQTFINWERESRYEWLSTKLTQDCLEEKIWHEFYPHSRDQWWFEWRMSDRKHHRKKLQRLKEEWAEEAEEYLDER